MRRLLRSLIIPLIMTVTFPAPAALLGGVFRGKASAVDTAGIFGAPGSTLDDADFTLSVTQNLSTSHSPYHLSGAFLALNGHGKSFDVVNPSLVFTGGDGIAVSESSVNNAFSLSISGLNGLYAFPPLLDPSGIVKLDRLVDPAHRSGTFQFAGGAAGVSSGTLTISSFQTGPVPEPATWAMMIVGFGAIGAAIRPKRRAAALDLPAS